LQQHEAPRLLLLTSLRLSLQELWLMTEKNIIAASSTTQHGAAAAAVPPLLSRKETAQRYSAQPAQLLNMHLSRTSPALQQL
jgi:hypothetical protein